MIRERRLISWTSCSFARPSPNLLCEKTTCPHVTQYALMTKGIDRRSNGGWSLAAISHPAFQHALKPSTKELQGRILIRMFVVASLRFAEMAVGFEVSEPRLGTVIFVHIRVSSCDIYWAEACRFLSKADSPFARPKLNLAITCASAPASGPAGSTSARHHRSTWRRCGCCAGNRQPRVQLRRKDTMVGALLALLYCVVAPDWLSHFTSMLCCLFSVGYSRCSWLRLLFTVIVPVAVRRPLIKRPLNRTLELACIALGP